MAGVAESPRYMIFEEGPSGRFFNYLDREKLFNMPCISLWYFAWKFEDITVRLSLTVQR